jgi:threonylcarbamoyladenosine tRNA methylthiotransferase MtaB
MKVYLDTIGCRLNQAEIEKFASQFHAAGHQIVATAAESDLAVINTCTVTSQAASDSRQKIRQAWRAGCRRIIPAGCLSTLEGDALLSIEGVDEIMTNVEKDHLVSSVLISYSDVERINIRQQVEGSRKRTRAFIKAQDGCDQHCTYCITRFARGKSRSVPLEDVIIDILAAENAGAKEAVLSGVQLGSWGRDLNPARDISQLIREVLDATKIPRIRLSSIEPWDLPEDFYVLWENARLCRQLHLPLQSGCKSTLKRMGRMNTPESYLKIVERVRSRVPDMALTTDIIVGFPGETNEEFDESCNFVRRISFAGGHIFGYSARAGTSALLLPGKIETEVRKSRSRVMHSILVESESAYQDQFIGQNLEVLWEGAVPDRETGWHLSGLTGNYLRIKAQNDQHLVNEISNVKITLRDQSGLVGEIQ